MAKAPQALAISALGSDRVSRETLIAAHLRVVEVVDGALQRLGAVIRAIRFDQILFGPQPDPFCHNGVFGSECHGKEELRLATAVIRTRHSPVPVLHFREPPIAKRYQWIWVPRVFA